MKTLSPYNFGNKVLVENCQKIKISDFLKQYKLKLKRTLLQSEISTSGFEIELVTSCTHYGGIRYWFKCPLCGLRVGVLFNPLSDVVGCRECLGLKYAKQRYKGMIEERLMDKT